VPDGEAPTAAVTLRFLSLGTEFLLSAKKPGVGDIMKRNGDAWIVVDVREDAQGNTVVTLRPRDGSAA
jgi:hypothetical protein